MYRKKKYEGMTKTVWLLTTTYENDYAELNGVFDSEEKAQKQAQFIRENAQFMGKGFSVKSQKISEHFVL